MKRVFAAVLVAATCAVGSTPGFARGGLGHVGGFANHGGLVRDLRLSWGPRPPRCPPSETRSPAPQMPAFENRIPAPLAAPSQPPVINGPSARSPYGGVM